MDKHYRFEKKLAIILCLVVLFLSSFSMGYLVYADSHHCQGQHCPVCLIPQTAESTVKQLSLGLLPVSGAILSWTAAVVLWMAGCFEVMQKTPVKLKIRMND